MSFGGGVVEAGDFYIEKSVLHPIVVGIPVSMHAIQLATVLT
jgi:hypothetical protein